MTEKSEKSNLIDKKSDVPRNPESTFNGPVKDRSCTDVICCIVFVVFVFLLAVVAAWAFAFGDIRRVIYPTNSKGQVCGVDIKDRKYLVFFDMMACLKMGPSILITGCPTPQVCVKSCPDYFWSWQQSPDSDVQRRKMICLDGKNGLDEPYKKKSIAQLVKDNECAPYTIKSEPVAGRCVPKSIASIFANMTSFRDSNSSDSKAVVIEDKSGNQINGSQIQESDGQMTKFAMVAEVFNRILDDILKSKFHILVFLFVAMLISLLWVILLRFFAKVMVWISILFFALLFTATTIFTFVRYSYLIRHPEAQTESFSRKQPVDSLMGMAKLWLGLGIISAILLTIVLIVLIFLRERIRIAISIIAETSKAISYMMTSLLWPIFPFLLQLMVIALFISVAMALSTISTPEGVQMNSYSDTDNVTIPANGTEEPKSNVIKNMAKYIPCDPLANGTAGKVCHFVKYGGKAYITVIQLFNAFMFFWLFNFVIALGQVTLAGAFSAYYFAFTKPQDIPALPILTSLGRALRYHLGTMAVGSLIIAIVQTIRVILEYIDAKTKQTQNDCAQFVLKCCKCCFWCLEKFLKFINKNVYIMVAMYGQSFCPAAKNAFNLIFRNLVRVVVVDKVTDFVLFIGKVVVAVGIGALAYFFFDGTYARGASFFKDITPELTYFYIPVIILVLCSYLIATLFFAVYDMGVDTLFLCFLEDLERNDGSPDKPYFMSKDLMEILGKTNKKAPPPPSEPQKE